jgi:pantoate--beta-alanine ligase
MILKDAALLINNMEIVDTIEQMKALRHQVTGSVGFVPTMGYLHNGHISLARQAKKDASVAVASIFVNPTQFGPAEDLSKYPRDIDRDLTLLKEANTDIVFIPSDREMYPTGFSSWVEVDKITVHLEGKSRPGHFKGVTTIVAKLFNIVDPNFAYFGQKDAQQVAVINKMVSDLNMNIKIITMPTIRESDGLAMSSRNVYLNPQQRSAAIILHKALSQARQLYSCGTCDAIKLRKEMADIINKEPLAQIDYVSIADSDNLEEIDTIKGKTLVSLAVYFGKTRLIDNIVIGN